MSSTSAGDASARVALLRAGVHTPISDEELASIAERASRASQQQQPDEASLGGDEADASNASADDAAAVAASFDAYDASPPPSSGSGNGSGSGSSSGSGDDELSLPSALLAELEFAATPRAAAAAPALPQQPQHQQHSHASSTAGGRATDAAAPASGSAVQREYALRIDQLTAQLEAALHARRLTEHDCQRRVHEANERARRAQDTADAASRSAASAQAAAELAEQRAHASLAASRLQLADAIAGAALAVCSPSSSSSFLLPPPEPIAAQQLASELRRLPPEALTPRQFVQLNVLEALLPLQSRCDALRRELEARDAGAGAMREVAERERTALVQAAAVSAAREARSGERAALLEAEVAHLHAQLGDAVRAVDELRAKGAAFDALEVRVAEAQRASAALDSARAERDASEARAAALQTRVEHLVAESAGQAAALEEARLRARGLECGAERLEGLARDAARARDAMGEQLLRAQIEAAGGGSGGGGLEARVEAGLRRMQAEREHEMEALRLGARELHERELRVLREARADTEAEAARLRDALAALQADAQSTRLQLQTRAEEAAAAAAEARAQLRLRGLELEQMTLAQAAAADGLVAARREADMLRDRLALVQTECVRLEASSDRERRSLVSTLEAEQRRLADYEKMEVHVDAAVLAAAAAPEVVDGAATVVTDEAGIGAADTDAAAIADSGTAALPPPALVQSLQMPSSSQRRMQQAIGLARELLAARGEAAALTTRNESQRALLEQARADLASAREQLDAVGGPHEYFLQMLRQREEEVRAARAEHVELRAQLSEARRRGADLAAERERVAGEARQLGDKLAVAAAAEGNLRALLLEANFARTVGGGAEAVPPSAGEPQLAPSPAPAPQRKASPSTAAKLRPRESQGFTAEAPLAEGISFDFSGGRAPVPAPPAMTTLNFFSVREVDLDAGGVSPAAGFSRVTVRPLVRAPGNSPEAASAPLPRWYSRRG